MNRPDYTILLQVDSDAIVEVWKDVRNDPINFAPWQDYANDITDKGYNMILSAPWYLNVIEYGQDWRGFYLVEPTNFTGKIILVS